MPGEAGAARVTGGEIPAGAIRFARKRDAGEWIPFLVAGAGRCSEGRCDIIVGCETMKRLERRRKRYGDPEARMRPVGGMTRPYLVPVALKAP